MAFGQNLEAKGRAGCQGILYRLQRGYPNYVYEFQAYQGTYRDLPNMYVNFLRHSSPQAALEALHPNIACMRHPDHIGSKGGCHISGHGCYYSLVVR